MAQLVGKALEQYMFDNGLPYEFEKVTQLVGGVPGRAGDKRPDKSLLLVVIEPSNRVFGGYYTYTEATNIAASWRRKRRVKVAFTKIVG